MPATVLLVDDDHDDLALLKEAILNKDSRLNCMCFDNPLEAMRVIMEELVVVPEYIFLDFNMPYMRGDKFLESLRQQPHFKEVIVTILSTGMSDQIKTLMFEQGANHAFKKPDKFADYVPILSAVIS